MSSPLYYSAQHFRELADKEPQWISDPSLCAEADAKLALVVKAWEDFKAAEHAVIEHITSSIEQLLKKPPTANDRGLHYKAARIIAEGVARNGWAYFEQIAAARSKGGAR